LPRNSRSSIKLIIDTSTLFSAIYNPWGKEAFLFTLADKGICSILIVDYVLEELREIFKRKNIDFNLVLDLLECYNNVEIKGLTDLNNKEINLAKQIIDDPEDRPIFIFAYRLVMSTDNIYLISGDKGFFKDDVQKALKGRVLKTAEFIELIRII
jgi:predicted nucleic acid-binding protein